MRILPSRLLIPSAAVLLVLAPAMAQHDLDRRGMFGVQLAPVTEQNLSETGLDKVLGIMVGGVFPGTPAEVAGLKTGDVILRVDQTDILVFDDFLRKAQTYRGGDEVTLRVQRKAETLELKFKLASRPKETSEDFDVIYDTLRVGELRLRTIVTKPKTAGKHPAVLYIQDLGPVSVDWFSPQMQNPTRTLLTELTKRGIVTMRLELAGFGDSDGDRAEHSGFDSHVPHFAAALGSLRHYDFVDSNAVFVFGERFGSIAAPLVAADAQPTGVAVWSAFGRPYVTAQLDLSRQHQKLEAYNETEIAKSLTTLEAVLKAVMIDGKSVKDVGEANAEHAAMLAQLAANGDNILGRSVRFFRELAKIDPAAAWKRVGCDVLVLRGACDFASCSVDSQAIIEAVNSAHAGHAKFVELPGIDGMFGKAQDMEEAYLAGSPGPFNPVIVDELAHWMAKRDAKPGSQ